MITTYKGVSGQSLYDIALSTYGTIDKLVKLMEDSNADSLDNDVVTGQQFIFDNSQVVDENVQASLTINNIVLATASSGAGNVYAITDGGARRVVDTTGFAPANNGGTPAYKTLQYQYTATTDNVNYISLPLLIGKDIFAVEKEIKPLLSSEWTFDKTNGDFNLVTIDMYEGETLFIYYQELVIL